MNATNAPTIHHPEPPTPRGSASQLGNATPVTSRSGSFLGSWFQLSHDDRNSSATLSHLIGLSSTLALPARTIRRGSHGSAQKRGEREKLPLYKRTRSGKAFASAWQRMTNHEKEYRITHIAETIMQQKYLIKLCRALMLYGAPTHQLEEYMKYSARLLEINAQFLYIPGCMIMSFDDV
jgi:hypothetical protein